MLHIHKAIVKGLQYVKVEIALSCSHCKLVRLV